VILLNAGSGHSTENPRHNYIAKYGKFVYSTHFPFNVLPAGKTYAPDATVVLTRDGLTLDHRIGTRANGVAPGMMWCEFVEYVHDEAQLIRVAVLMWRDLQVRLTFVQPTRRVRVVEGPGALGASGAALVSRRSDVAAGWEYAEAEGRAIAIKRLAGYDAQSVSAPFLGYSNINLASPYAEVPIVSESTLALAPRSLGAATLVRPAPFDPALEFAGLSVQVDPRGTFRVTFADGERAYISLANELPQDVRVGDIPVRGAGVRGIRIRADSSRVCGIGITSVDHVLTLAAAGTIELERTPHAVRVVTNVGATLEEEWLGAAPRSIQVVALDGTWVDVTARCEGSTIPDALVREWAHCNERTFVEFRLG
jgi:hypothetical protein